MILPENEAILYQARVGKRVGLLYNMVSAICYFFAVSCLVTGIATWILLGGTAPISLLIIAAVFAVFGTVALFLRRTMLRREYILTDRRLVIRKGGALSKSTRFLYLEDVKGIDLSNNFLIDLFGVCSMDFFSPSISAASRKFLIFSFSTTPFKFQFINKQDGEAIYRILSELREKT